MRSPIDQVPIRNPFLARPGRSRSPGRCVLDVSLGQPVPKTQLADPEVLRGLRDRGLAPTGHGHHTVAELHRMGLGTINILPAAPLGTTDQMSPIRAAVPRSRSTSSTATILADVCVVLAGKI